MKKPYMSMLAKKLEKLFNNTSEGEQCPDWEEIARFIRARERKLKSRKDNETTKRIA